MLSPQLLRVSPYNVSAKSLLNIVSRHLIIIKGVTVKTFEELEIY